MVIASAAQDDSLKKIAETRTGLGRIENILAISGIIAAVVAACAVALIHFYDQVNWQSYYKNANLFGRSCSIASGAWSGSFDLAASEKHDFKAFEMPHRGKEHAPRVYEGQYLATKCVIDYSGEAKRENLSTIGLGMIFGASAVYLNGKKYFVTDGTTDVTFPMPEEFKQQQVELLLISRGLPSGTVGMATLRPPYETTELNTTKLILRYLNSVFTEQTMLRFGLGFGCLAMLIVLWIYGMRYPDMKWIMLFAALICLLNVLKYTFQFNFRFQGVASRAFSASYFALMYAQFMFVIAFVRGGLNRILAVRFIFLLTMILCVLSFAVGEDLFFKFRMLILSPACYGVVLMGVAIFIILQRAMRDEVHAKLKSRSRYAVGIAALTFVILLIQVIFDDAYGIYIDSTTQATSLVSFVFLAVKDLLSRQADYYTEQERRIASERSLEIAQSVSATVSYLVHDLKRPLQTVENFLGHIERNKSMTSEDMESLKRTLSASLLDAGGLLRDFAFLNPESPILYETVDLGAVALEAFQSVAVEQKNVAFHNSVSGVMVAADRRIFKRVLQNIMLNALEATNYQTEISIKVHQQSKERVYVMISNTGSSISEGAISKVFDINYTAGKSRGSGLGLAFCKMAIEKHGGEISCKSASNTVTFTLDLAVGSKVSIAAKSNIQRVAVVEDDEFVLYLWQKSKLQFDVLLYRTPEEFLAQLSEGAKFDAAIFDLNFTNSFLTGIDLAIAARQKSPKTQLFLASNQIVTNGAKTSAFDKQIDKGPDAFLREVRG